MTTRTTTTRTAFGSVKPLSVLLDEQMTDIRSRLQTLLAHSNLVYRDFSNASVVFIGPSSHWAALPDTVRSLQWELRRDARRWFDLVAQIVSDRGEDPIKRTQEIRSRCEAAIEQDGVMWERSTDDFARHLWQDLTELTATVSGLYSESQRPTYVPDTNALIDNPALDEWDFAGEKDTVFEIVLTPTVLSELDSLKTGRSGHPRTEKAQRVIRQIKEYQRRGSLLDGVVLRRDRSVVSAIAVEPDFTRTLAWLDASVSDDRFLASTLEVVRRRPHAAVVAVTGDVNLQNKFVMAGLPFVEPPEPSRTPVPTEVTPRDKPAPRRARKESKG